MGRYAESWSKKSLWRHYHAAVWELYGYVLLIRSSGICAPFLNEMFQIRESRKSGRYAVLRFLNRLTRLPASAENYYSTSPFTYCLNNPLNYIDPLGTDTVDVKDVDWNKFDPKKDVVALDEVAVSVPNALTKVGTRALEPISGFWGYVGYYLLDIGSTYHSEQTRFTYKVGTDGVITGVAPMVGTPPLPGFAKTSNLNTIRGLWSLTKQGSSKVMKHPIRGLFYKSKSDGLWWVKDQTKHGGSFYKVYKETNKGLEWHKDADKYGNFIINKHKSDVGIFIPWKELSK